MGLVVETGAGVAGANSYISRADADTFFADQMHTSVWDAATDADKDKALITATRLLDAYVPYAGVRVTWEQPLDWPRSGAYARQTVPVDSDEIPTDLKRAVCLMAQLVLPGDRTADNDLAGFAEIEVGEVRIKSDRRDRPGVIPATILKTLGSLASRAPGGVIPLARS